MDQGLIATLFTAVHLILFLVALFEIISSSRPLLNKVLWGVLVLLLPCAGLIIYYLLGRIKK